MPGLAAPVQRDGETVAVAFVRLPVTRRPRRSTITVDLATHRGAPGGFTLQEKGDPAQAEL